MVLGHWAIILVQEAPGWFVKLGRFISQQREALRSDMNRSETNWTSVCTRTAACVRIQRVVGGPEVIHG
ncbi:hypothetical protein M378DRAFT_914786 [Amanita muscaria Koide BX008]|uniref:Uncharacterized protein n=1 Tax=Amanita muscaria (strain Koide BX008) TaxID=946122 RepID=A0A0C2T2A4_AMAMK|nr:hypothetical protein M378DRAFT_914786 [Amanita muscaria Koide BX008]